MINELLYRQLDAQYTAVKQEMKQKLNEADPSSVEAWGLLFEQKIRRNFASTARKTEFTMRYGMAKNIINEIR